MLLVPLYSLDTEISTVTDGRLLSYPVPGSALDTSVLLVGISKARSEFEQDGLVAYDILRWGDQDLSLMPAGDRLALLGDILPPVGGRPERFAGANAVAENVYLVRPLDPRDSDPRAHGSLDLDGGEVRHCSFGGVSLADSIRKYPAVPNEGVRAMSYSNLVDIMIRKMRGKWRDAYKRNHQVGNIPYDADDLRQFGMMQVVIALRKYNGRHSSGAKEVTFIYTHLFNRFAQLVSRHTTSSQGYGAHFVRANTDHPEQLDLLMNASRFPKERGITDV